MILFLHIYQIEYEQKSIAEQNGEYHIVDFFVPDISISIEKINIWTEIRLYRIS